MAHLPVLHRHRLGPQTCQKFGHRLDVRQARRVCQGQRLFGQQRRRHQRQASILGPCNRNLTLERPTARHNNRIHLPASLLVTGIGFPVLSARFRLCLRLRPGPGLRLAPPHIGLQGRLQAILARLRLFCRLFRGVGYAHDPLCTPERKKGPDCACILSPGQLDTRSRRRSSSVVERTLGKGEVGSSILPCGTISPNNGRMTGPERPWSEAAWRRRSGYATNDISDLPHQSPPCPRRNVTDMAQAFWTGHFGSVWHGRYGEGRKAPGLAIRDGAVGGPRIDVSANFNEFPPSSFSNKNITLQKVRCFILFLGVSFYV